MSQTVTAIKIDEQIIPIHLIETDLTEKDIYNRRKPLQGENTSRGVIKTNKITTGTISCRLSNITAPILLYLITGKETNFSHVPETKTLFQRTLIPDYKHPPEFSLIEITDGTCHETPAFKATGFTIIQEETSPLKLEIQIESSNQKAETIKPEITQPESTHFFYLPEPMKIQADFTDEPIIRIDTLNPITKKPLYIEAYSREEYEQNRYGKFTIQIENYQFEKTLRQSYDNSRYRHECFGDMTVIIVDSN